ncbi:uncharacterized protein LOC132199566 isoform X2 [Neocloeon triangulifer]|uniref:uncharacterized protein LOC132199566 isoform X2 n=1 Tax=Neocloeon triangulifer TaxID=2078957 RepID=UPI00286FA87A|nr:uncharacterized protein LOC132199566 isoform X2 [Neocloeon triangulifer]
MWSSAGSDHAYPTIRSTYHSYPGGSDTTWSQHSGTKGRGHLWSALLVFMVCIVTLAVLAVVGLALVLGGHNVTKKPSSLDTRPSATWGEEVEEPIKYPDFPQRHSILQTAKPPPPPPPPPPMQPLTTSTEAPRTTTQRRAVTTTTAQTTFRTPVKPQLRQDKLATPPPYNVQGGVDFSRVEKDESNVDRSEWTPIVEEEFVMHREPIGEAAVVSTLADAIDTQNLNKFPSRSYSGLGHMRPMPTLFPSKKSNNSETAEIAAPVTTSTTTSAPLITKEVPSPFFVASLTSVPPLAPEQPDRPKISATYKQEDISVTTDKSFRDQAAVLTNTHIRIKESDRHLNQDPSPGSLKMGGALAESRGNHEDQYKPVELISATEKVTQVKNPTDDSRTNDRFIKMTINNTASIPVYIVDTTEKQHVTPEPAGPIFTIEMTDEGETTLSSDATPEEEEPTEDFTEEALTTLLPEEVAEETKEPVSGTTNVGPTLSSLLLKPLTASQRTAEVDSMSPIKAGLLFREPKSGPASSGIKESVIQAFPKNEFNSAPAFLRRNNTIKKTTTATTTTTSSPPTTITVSMSVSSPNCTCADRLQAQGLGRKLCDGVVDCWDFSDETGCDWCKEGHYVCVHSRACIPKKKLCDGHRDCPFGDDERTCVSIAPDTKRADSLQYHDDGVLMVQQRGEWGPLCIEKLEESSWRLGNVARAVCRALTYSDFDLAEQVIDPSSKGPFFELNFERNGSRGATPRLAVMSSHCPSKAAVRLGCSDLQCGVRPLAVSQWARIVGGGNAGPGAWPWQAALYKEGQFQCGGSLISSQWLLSASHCFAHNLDAYWVARMGALRRGTDLPSPYEQLRRINRIIQHPGYLDTGFINDLALLKMERPVDFSDYIRPVCLPPPTAVVTTTTESAESSTSSSPVKPEEQDPAENSQMCTVVGWGQLSEVGRIFPDTLQEVQLPLISTEECRRRTVFLPLYRVTDDMFCAGFDRGGRDACLGDSGGPLMCQRSDGHWELTGITSNGYGCARAHRPGVYTKVANYVNWINAVLKSSPVDELKLEKKTIPCPSGQRRCALGQCMAPPPAGRCDGDYCPPPSA